MTRVQGPTCCEGVIDMPTKTHSLIIFDIKGLILFMDQTSLITHRMNERAWS